MKRQGFLATSCRLVPGWEWFYFEDGSLWSSIDDDAELKAKAVPALSSALDGMEEGSLGS